MPLTKCTRDIVFINTSVPEERIFLLKPKAAHDEVPAKSTDLESDNVIQRYSKRPRQLSKFCLADYNTCDTSSCDESEGSLSNDISQKSDLLYKAKNGTNYKKRKVPRVIDM